jgi:tight adherence protein B
MKIAGKDRLLYGGAAGLSGFLATMIFYQNVIAAGIVGVLLCIVYPELCRKTLAEKKKRKLVREFREILSSMITALRAGRSLERALEAVGEDMDPEVTPLLYPEWMRMLGRLQVNVSAEHGLKELAYTCGIEEIESLAETIEISKKSQGDLIRVMENTAALLRDKIEMQEEVHVMLAKKRLEQRIINIMPFAVLGMLLLISPDYLAPLYTSLKGRLIMSSCVLLTAGSLWLSRHIADIEI